MKHDTVVRGAMILSSTAYVVIWNNDPICV